MPVLQGSTVAKLPHIPEALPPGQVGYLTPLGTQNLRSPKAITAHRTRTNERSEISVSTSTVIGYRFFWLGDARFYQYET